MMLLDGWGLVRFLHVVAAIFWVGGQLLLALVVAPAARARLVPEARAEVFSVVGRRFALLTTWGLFPILVASGLALAWHRGVTLASLSRPGYGFTLTTKILLFAVALALSAGHGMAAATGSFRLSRGLGMATLGVSLVIVLLATSLVP